MSQRKKWRVILGARSFAIVDRMGNEYAAYKQLTRANLVCEELNAVSAAYEDKLPTHAIAFTTKRNANDVMQDYKHNRIPLAPYGWNVANA